MNLPLPPRHHQTHAPSRMRAYREMDCAERALRAARKQGATPDRLARLQQAVWDAGQLHLIWQRAQSFAAQAGAYEHLEYDAYDRDDE